MGPAPRKRRKAPCTTSSLAAAVPSRARSVDAKVTVIEYASPTCPHCAKFHNEVYPQFKTEYIDSGKVKFVLRPFVRNVLDAVVFMLADAGEAVSHRDRTFSRQAVGVAEKPRDALLAIAKQLGFTGPSFEAADQELFTAMETMREQASGRIPARRHFDLLHQWQAAHGDKTLEQLKADRSAARSLVRGAL
jgi:hypothetical protein